MYSNSIFAFYGYILFFSSFLSFFNTHLYCLVGCLSMVGCLICMCFVFLYFYLFSALSACFTWKGALEIQSLLSLSLLLLLS